jgi:hypothetical protein
MSEDIRFAAPWGNLLRVITIGCLLIFTALITAGTFGVPARLPAVRWPLIGIPVLLLVATLPYMVRGYTVKPRENVLVVHRLGWSTRLPLAGLVSATPDPDATKGSLRIAGNGGLFAFCGLYYSSRLGRYRMYGTDLARAVILRWPDRVAVVTPEQPDQFARAIAPDAQMNSLNSSDH